MSLPGVWRLESATVLGGGPAPSASGLLRLDATAGSFAAFVVADTGFPGADVFAAQGPYAVDGDGVTAGSFSGDVTVDGDELTLTSGGQTYVFERYTPTRVETLTVAGRVHAPLAPAGAPLHVGLVFVVRDGDDLEISADPRDAAELDFVGDTATFSLTREEGARGTERVPFGDAGVAIGFVVVYEDRINPGKLDHFYDSDCSTGGTTADCVRGVSPILLGYRDGTSTELTATPYGYLLDGWSRALVVDDHSTGSSRNGVASIVGESDFDVWMPADPDDVAIPGFDL
jgi:hypothetical protein